MRHFSILISFISSKRQTQYRTPLIVYRALRSFNNESFSIERYYCLFNRAMNLHTYSNGMCDTLVECLQNIYLFTIFTIAIIRCDLHFERIFIKIMRNIIFCMLNRSLRNHFLENDWKLFFSVHKQYGKVFEKSYESLENHSNLMSFLGWHTHFYWKFFFSLFFLLLPNQEKCWHLWVIVVVLYLFWICNVYKACVEATKYPK